MKTNAERRSAGGWRRSKCYLLPRPPAATRPTHEQCEAWEKKRKEKKRKKNRHPHPRSAKRGAWKKKIKDKKIKTTTTRRLKEVACFFFLAARVEVF